MDSNLIYEKIIANFPNEYKLFDINEDAWIEKSDLKNIEFFYSLNKSNFISQFNKDSFYQFISEKLFIKYFKVYKFWIRSTYSNRRSDHYSYNCVYALYIGNIRINDDYIKSILPEETIDSDIVYNDSSPGPGNTYEISCDIDWEETIKFKNNYCIIEHSKLLNNTGLLNHNDFFKKIYYGLSQKQHVWHEYGHLTGWVIASKIGYNFGEIEYINLNSKENNPEVKLSNNIYNINKSIENDYERLKDDINKDSKRLIVYFIYILMGSVFNIRYYKTFPTIEDFEDCFGIGLNDESYNKFYKQAEKDFNKILGFYPELENSNVDLEYFKFLAFDLFYLLDRYFIFELLKDHISEFDLNHNGQKIIEKSILIKIVGNIDKILNDNYFFNDILILIEKYERLIVAPIKGFYLLDHSCPILSDELRQREYDFNLRIDKIITPQLNKIKELENKLDSISKRYNNLLSNTEKRKRIIRPKDIENIT